MKEEKRHTQDLFIVYQKLKMGEKLKLQRKH